MFHAKYLSSSYVGFSKENVLTIYIKGKTITPGAGLSLAPGLLFEQIW
jgi:hypothetical protein